MLFIGDDTFEVRWNDLGGKAVYLLGALGELLDWFCDLIDGVSCLLS